MPVRGACAVRLQLARERRHIEWLSKHIPKSAQLSAAHCRVVYLEAELAVILESTNKKSEPKPALPVSQLLTGIRS